MSPTNRRVWILGAGFSQPLGGPLLAELFRLEPHGSCHSAFPANEFPGLGDTLYNLQTCYHWGRTEAGHWEDAEQFLAYVDDAYVGKDGIKRANLGEVLQRAQRLMDGGGRLPLPDQAQAFLSGNLHLAARRALAAQCSRFLLNRQPASEETWLAFREWAESLDPSVDAIISFNYDRVLEMLDPKETRFHVLMPSEVLDSTRVPVYKLHGSVDWVVDGQKLQRRKPNDTLKSLDPQIAIAPPGRSKSQFVAEHLEPLWTQVEGLLSHAGVVLIVGYGFPKTDSIAKSRILKALSRSNQCPEWTRDIHVILGPEVTNSSSQRVCALLQACTGGRGLIIVPASDPVGGSPFPLHGHLLRIKQHPLWSQDFLGDWRERILPILYVRQ
jgi:hypothetical protein